MRHDVRCAMLLPAHANPLHCARPAPPADVDDPALEPIPVPKLDALPWAVRWMCAGTVEASGMVGALAGAADAGGLFGALEVSAPSALRRTHEAVGSMAVCVCWGGGKHEFICPNSGH